MCKVCGTQDQLTYSRSGYNYKMCTQHAWFLHDKEDGSFFKKLSDGNMVTAGYNFWNQERDHTL